MLHPNYSIKKAQKLSEILGCTVKPKKRHGELVFTHPKILTPYVISVNKESIGKGFLSWIKPALGVQTDTLRENTKIWKMARTVFNHDNDVITISDLFEEIGMYGRKNTNDILVHLAKKGYLERITKGKYRKTSKLIKLFFKYDENNYDIIEKDNKTDNILSENKQSNKEDKIKKDKDDIKLDAILDKFDKIANRLESLLDRFETESDLRDLVVMFEDTIKKKLKKENDI